MLLSLPIFRENASRIWLIASIRETSTRHQREDAEPPQYKSMAMRKRVKPPADPLASQAPTAAA